MLYPDKLVEIQEGLSIYVPDPEMVRSAYEQQLGKDPATAFPFWAKIWPAATAMAAFLKAEPGWIGGKRVLELGAGIGVPSFVMATQAAEMIISDHAPEAVALMEKNIQYLRLQNVKAIQLDWNTFPDHLHADILLLSDINYAPKEFEPLLALIRRFMNLGTTVILATPQRITANLFITELQPYIKRSLISGSVIRIVILSI